MDDRTLPLAEPLAHDASALTAVVAGAVAGPAPARGSGTVERSSAGEVVILGSRYRLRELIGRGGTASVHRAWDDLLHREVAVKVFHHHPAVDPAQQERRLLEMQALAAVDHPGLVAVYDAGIADPADPDTSTYLVMELVPGTSLADRLTHGAVPAALVAAWGRTLADALSEMQAAGLVHRDVKPANVLVSPTHSVKLGDFGLAKVLHADARITPRPDVLGTPAYLSPEQAASDTVGPPSDVYSLGLVLLECLTGRREYAGDPISSALARLLRSPVVPASLPGTWPELLRAMTARDPGRRPDAAAVSRTLAEVSRPVVSRPAVRPAGPPDRAAGSSPATLESLFRAPARPAQKRTSGRTLVSGALLTTAAAAMIGVALGASGAPESSTPPVSTPTTSLVTGTDPTAGSGVRGTRTSAGTSSTAEPSDDAVVAPAAVDPPATAQAAAPIHAEQPAPEPVVVVEPVVVEQPPPLPEEPVFPRPVVQEPVIQAPAVQAPAVQAPAVQAPAVQAPVVQAPAPSPAVVAVPAPAPAPAPDNRKGGNGKAEEKDKDEDKDDEGEEPDDRDDEDKDKDKDHD